MPAGAIGTPAEFLERDGPLLYADEARRKVILGLVWALHDRSGVYPEFCLWVAEEVRAPSPRRS
ncbi:MAG: hypothetical protein ABIJ48_09995 [Actinomycetota bacterium]